MDATITLALLERKKRLGSFMIAIVLLKSRKKKKMHQIKYQACYSRKHGVQILTKAARHLAIRIYAQKSA